MKANDISLHVDAVICFVESQMQFILGVFLFVVVAGAVDAFLPWPKARRGGQ